MKKILPFIMLLVTTLSITAQPVHGSVNNKFAIVKILQPNAMINENSLTVKYSDGHEENLLKLLKLPVPPGNMYNAGEREDLEISILDYFYSNGYELLYITEERGQTTRYYFKHK